MSVSQHIRFCRLSRDDYVCFRNRLALDAPMSRQWARSVIASTASALGVPSIGAHSMRKIYACRIYRSSNSVEAVRLALNHSKADTTVIYLKGVLS
jgi:integrase